MRLLKIGTLNIPSERWKDALRYFDRIDVLCFDSEKEIDSEDIRYYKINSKSILNRAVAKLIRVVSSKPKLDYLSVLLLKIFYLLNRNIFDSIKSIKYDFIHSSYNDFDESALLTAVLKPSNYVRAQKETRLSYSYLEKYAFENASIVVLNDVLNLELYRRKYGQNFLKNKQIIYGLDEDVRSNEIASRIVYDTKLSDIDKRIHAVILAGRVLSNPNDPRSGGRLYYVNLIKKLNAAGIVVHLYTGKIVPWEGKNPYSELEKSSRDFIIEGSLDFVNDTINAYKALSKYDIGVCHAHLENMEVTEFDKVNIPHRYYEYQLAHVAPFDVKGGNLLLEKKAKENHALICNDYSEISLESIKNISWEKYYFDSYIRELYYVSDINSD